MACNYEENLAKFRDQIKAALTILEETRKPNSIRGLLDQLRVHRDNGDITEADYDCVRGLFIPIRPLKYDDFKKELKDHFKFDRGLRTIQLGSETK